MALILAVLVVLGVLVLAGAFAMNARRLRRDMNEKLETFRARLEDDATSIVEEILDRHQVRK